MTLIVIKMQLTYNFLIEFFAFFLKNAKKTFQGINPTSQWTKHHPLPDPNFEVVSAGTLGALLLVKIPPRSEIFAVPGTAIAVSGKV
jgi:hypothetical protein